MTVSPGFAPPAQVRPVPWWSGTSWTLGTEATVAHFDGPLSALVESVRHAHDIGERPDLAAIRRRVARIEARLTDRLAGLDGAFDSRARAALELVRGKAKATQEWLRAMAAQPALQPQPVAMPTAPKRRSAGGCRQGR